MQVPHACCLCSPRAGLQGTSWHLEAERSGTEGAGGDCPGPGGALGFLGRNRGMPWGRGGGGGCGPGWWREEAS